MSGAPREHREDEQGIEVSVVIPSIGRETLVRAVRSALDQEVPLEVLVADDSGAGRASAVLEAAPDLAAALREDRLRVLATGGGAFAAGARTLAMRGVRGRFVAFLDDDDMFLPGHLAHAAAHLRSVPAPALYASREVVRDARGGRLQPAELQADGTVDGYLYADAAWRTRSRLLSMSTLVVTADLADEPMVHRTEYAEDTSWLLAVGQRGARLHVDAFVGAAREAALERDADRVTTRDREVWTAQLARLAPPRRVASMLAGREGREAVRRGAPGEVIRLYRRSRDFDRDPRWLVPTALHVMVASARAAAERARGIGRRAR